MRHPSQCVVRTNTKLTFFSRQVSTEFLNQAIDKLCETDPVWLVLPAKTVPAMVFPKAISISYRLEFFDCDPNSQLLADLRKRLPNEFEIHPIDSRILERCEWRDDMKFYCGSLDNFMQNGLVLCMMRGDEIIVEAYVSSFGETQAEIGAVTYEAYRGKGYAPIACAYLIDALKQRGFLPYWSCEADNPASIKAARELGFRQENPYQIFEYCQHD